MLKKLKSKGGMAFVLVYIFYSLMIILTGNAISLGLSGSQAVSSLQTSDFNYFMTKAALNYYSNLFSNLQYVETSVDVPFDTNVSNSLTYKSGNFQYIDSTGAVDNNKLDELKKFFLMENQNSKIGLETAFGQFQALRKRATGPEEGSLDVPFLTNVPDEYHPAHKVFEMTIINEGIPNTHHSSEPITISTTISFFGKAISYDSFNSYEENTARIKTSLITDIIKYDEDDNSQIILPDQTVYTKYVSCVPTLDETSGDETIVDETSGDETSGDETSGDETSVKVWTWESFS